MKHSNSPTIAVIEVTYVYTTNKTFLVPSKLGVGSQQFICLHFRKSDVWHTSCIYIQSSVSIHAQFQVEPAQRQHSRVRNWNPNHGKPFSDYVTSYRSWYSRSMLSKFSLHRHKFWEVSTFKWSGKMTILDHQDGHMEPTRYSQDEVTAIWYANSLWIVQLQSQRIHEIITWWMLRACNHVLYIQWCVPSLCIWILGTWHLTG